MLCDECGKRRAKVHITKVVNDEHTKVHLCEECARRYQKEHSFGVGFEPSFSIHKFLAGLMEDFEEDYTGKSVIPKHEQECEKCGLTYAEFSKGGKLGCSRCYDTFREKLEPLLTRIHGNTEHNGKIPQHAGENIRCRKEVEQLKNELQRLVAQERFEEAAEVRDKIRDLEKKLEDD